MSTDSEDTNQDMHTARSEQAREVGWWWLVCGVGGKVGEPSVQNLIMSGPKTYN